MKNEIFLITFLLIVFFSIGDNNIDYRNIKTTDMYWEDMSNTMTTFEQRSITNSKLKFRLHEYYKNEEYIRQVQNEIKKLSNDISDLKVEADLSKGAAKKDFLANLLQMTSHTSKFDSYPDSFSYPSKSNWNEIKNQYINSLDRVSNTLEKSRELMSLKVEQ